jgi:hypothetical protein
MVEIRCCELVMISSTNLYFVHNKFNIVRTSSCANKMFNQNVTIRLRLNLMNASTSNCDSSKLFKVLNFKNSKFKARHRLDF